VAVAGACLTAVAIDPPRASFEVSPETLACTTFPLKKVGDRVNLERSLRIGDRLGGHLVTGHVDGIGVLRERRQGPAHLGLKFEMPTSLSRLVIEKGSIAIEGVSLTVNSCQGNTFAVNIIPHTAHATTLEGLKVGDRVNLETDLIGKYVARLLGKDGSQGEGVTSELLARHGFL
jgi:riboflavin synthase